MKVVDIRMGRILGKNEVGEICIKKPHVMKGYFGNAKATADTLHEEAGFIPVTSATTTTTANSSLWTEPRSLSSIKVFRYGKKSRALINSFWKM